jgi:UMP-CMP kinase
VDVPFILHLDCGEEVMLARLLKRGETSGRSDDNLESIKKRFVTYKAETREIVKYYDELRKDREVNAERDTKEIFEDIRKIFAEHKLI